MSVSFGRKTGSSAAKTLRFESLEERVVLSTTSVSADDGPTAMVAPADLGTSQGAIDLEWIRDLNYQQFHTLDPALIPYLLPSQIATIPNRHFMGLMSYEARQNLTREQVQALKVPEIGIDLLPSQQVSYLSVRQVESLRIVDFRHLPPEVIVHLSAEQLRSISYPEHFQVIPSASRAALTKEQVRALDVTIILLSGLTEQQIGYLTPAQVRSLGPEEFRFLGPDQIVHLTNAQIASIDRIDDFQRISPEARAALTTSQVQALNVSVLGIRNLPSNQRVRLLPAQIKTLSADDLVYLSLEQIAHVTPQQFASMSRIDQFREISPEIRMALTREQLLSVPIEIQAAVSVPTIAVPQNFVNPLKIPKAADGLAGDMQTQMERNAILALVPHTAVTHRTVRSGNWSDPATWQGGAIPDRGANVLVSSGHSVTFDTLMVQPIRTLRIDGHLRFAHNRSTRMLVDTIVVDTKGVLHIGTEAQPIDKNVTARIVFSAGSIDTTWDPLLISRGLVGRGQVRIHGSEVTPYAALKIQPGAGATKLVLDRVPINWKVGDRIVITGTKSNSNRDEHRTILGISGNTVTVEALRFSHAAPIDLGTAVYVAHTSRNVIIESANPNTIAERGHIMLAHNPDVQIANAGLYGLGRTNKAEPINDPVVVDGELTPGTGLNRRGRYSLHFHRNGVDANVPPAVVRGVAVVDSPGWGLVNHSSHVVMEENVAVNVFGSAFATEDGNEIGAFRRNLAIRSSGSGEHVNSRRDLHDYGHSGHGFWMQGPGVEVVDNIAVGQAYAGFMYYTASSKNLFSAANLDDPSTAGGQDMTLVGAVPLKTNSGNVTYGSMRGLEIWYHQRILNDTPSVIEGFTSWNILHPHVTLAYSGQIVMRGFILIGDLDAPSGTAIDAQRTTRGIVIEHPAIIGFKVGVLATVSGITSVDGGVFMAVRGIEVGPAESRLRTYSVTDTTLFWTLSDSQLNGSEQFDVYVV